MPPAESCRNLSTPSPTENERRSGQADREQEDREPVLAHLARRGEERSRVEERGQEAEEDDVRGKVDLLDAGHDADDEAREDEVARRGDARPARERRAQDDGGGEGEPDEQRATEARGDEGHPPRV